MIMPNTDLYQTLPNILKLFLDQNPDYKEIVLEYGDWGCYYENTVANRRSGDSIFALRWCLSPGRSPETSYPSSKIPLWNSMVDDFVTFLGEWESL